MPAAKQRRPKRHAREQKLAVANSMEDAVLMAKLILQNAKDKQQECAEALARAKTEQSDALLNHVRITAEALRLKEEFTKHYEEAERLGPRATLFVEQKRSLKKKISECPKNPCPDSKKQDLIALYEKICEKGKEPIALALEANKKRDELQREASKYLIKVEEAKRRIDEAKVNIKRAEEEHSKASEELCYAEKEFADALILATVCPPDQRPEKETAVEKLSNIPSDQCPEKETATEKLDESTAASSSSEQESPAGTAIATEKLNTWGIPMLLPGQRWADVLSDSDDDA